MKNMVQKGDYTSISKSAIGVLTKQGHSLTDIANMLGVTKSYISRVNSGQRSFTLDHLSALQAKTGQPVPLLVMESMPRNSVRPHLLPLFDLTMKLVREISGPAESASAKRRRPVSRFKKPRLKAA